MANVFEQLPVPPIDRYFARGSAIRADVRPRKIDLGIGASRDESGRTPIMAAVVEAVVVEAAKRHLQCKFGEAERLWSSR
jgi:aspartate/tyrosine/aromatic aminotransferase